MKTSSDRTDPMESRYAWCRLLVSLLIMTIGSAGMYSPTVVLPQIQEDFGISRSVASLPYTVTMLGFGLGSVLMGKISDRFGTLAALITGALGLSLGFMGAGSAGSITEFMIYQGVLIGLLGSAGTFTPVVADSMQWFSRHRGIALAVCMSGLYVGGTVWPPIMQLLIDHFGWRTTYALIGAFGLATLLPLSIMYRRRPPNLEAQQAAAAPARATRATFLAEIARNNPERPLGMAPATLQKLLCLAGVACCVAMSMPQVHIVAYCGDLGFGAARGAEMLALMLGLGIVSRLASGHISDRIGGLRTLLLGSVLQGVALLMYLVSSDLVSLYVVSGLFGLFQGGIVPAYALIVREHFPLRDVGARTGMVMMATQLGMALGGWLSGALHDLTGSYQIAFLNGLLWNFLNVAIVFTLLWRARRLTTA